MISLFWNNGNQSRHISIKVRKGGNSSQTGLGFARLRDRNRNPRHLQAMSCWPNGNGGVTKEAHAITNRDGVIIVDHGSRRKESNLMLSKV